MEEGTVQRLIEAAGARGDDPSWSIKVQPTGIQIVYTWQHEAWPHEDRNSYTVENFTSWSAIECDSVNPLLTAMFDLMKQKTEWKP